MTKMALLLPHTFALSCLLRGFQKSKLFVPRKAPHQHKSTTSNGFSVGCSINEEKVIDVKLFSELKLVTDNLLCTIVATMQILIYVICPMPCIWQISGGRRSAQTIMSCMGMFINVEVYLIPENFITSSPVQSWC